MGVGHLEQRTLDLFRVVLTSHCALPAKLNRQGTSIVNVASTGAFQGFVWRAKNKKYQEAQEVLKRLNSWVQFYARRRDP